jgi:response regulator RpfG family c-di-GMP phosphodiesterase
MFEIDNIARNVLIVEDDAAARRLLLESLHSKFQCDAVDSAEIALKKISEKEYAVVLLDIGLPEASGIDILSDISFISPNTVVVLMSGNHKVDFAVQAFRLGAFDYVAKPFTLRQIEAALERGFKHFEAKCVKDRYQRHLEELMSERATALDSAKKEVENSYQLTLKALVQALETRDYETLGHSERVVTFSLRLGHELGLSETELKNLELGAVLHDIGKIGVPDAILRKPAKLTEEEWTKMRLHPIHGQKILRNLPFLENAAEVVMQHHECWDGSGYPHGLRGETINIGARVFAVVDAFDAIVSDKIYRKGRSYEEAIAELDRCSGTQFDPQIVEAFKKVPQEDWLALHRRSVSQRSEAAPYRTIVNELLDANQQFSFVN